MRVSRNGWEYCFGGAHNKDLKSLYLWKLPYGSIRSIAVPDCSLAGCFKEIEGADPKKSRPQ